MRPTVEELAAVPLFAILGDDELGELATWFEVKTVSERVRLAGEGAAGYSFLVLLDGSASVTREGDDLATLGPGDFFGELAILGDGRRTATVTTTSAARLLVLFGTEFRLLQQRLPGGRGQDRSSRARAGRRPARRLIPPLDCRLQTGWGS